MNPAQLKTFATFVSHSIPRSANKTRATAEAGCKKRGFYKPLRKEFRHDGFSFRQIARERGVAIYEQSQNRCRNPSLSYEVVRVRLREGFEIHGRFVEPAEVYPASEAWGTDGFSVTNKDAAFQKLKQMA